MIGLGQLPGGTTSSARGMSDDGRVIVGYGNSATSPMEAMRWTLATGMVSLNFGTLESQALATSFDGTIIVGYRGQGAERRPIRWTAATGPVELTGLTGGTGEGVAYDMSPYTPGTLPAGGPLVSVIVGYSSSTTGKQAVRWQGAGSASALPMPPNGLSSIAYAVSSNTQYIVGSVNDVAGRWEFGGFWTSIGTLPGAPENKSTPWAVDAFGSVVGESSSSGTSLGTEAFIWEPGLGCRPLKDVLAAGGAQIAGWELIAARGLGYANATDRVIIGWGINPSGNTEAWVATLGRACYANCDGVNALTGNDIVCFINRFAGGNPECNCDGSTGAPLLTSNDFLCYINAYAAGCQ